MNSNSFVIKQKQKQTNKQTNKQYMKIEFQNSIIKVSFLCRIQGIKIA